MRWKLIAVAIFFFLAAYWILKHSFFIMGAGSLLFAVLVVAAFLFLGRRR